MQKKKKKKVSISWAVNGSHECLLLFQLLIQNPTALSLKKKKKDLLSLN